MTLQHVVGSIYNVANMAVVNIQVIEAPDGSLTLVDAGLQNSPRSLERALSASGRSLNAVRRILITHAHFDHIGGLRELQERTGAATYAHRVEAPIIRGEQAQTYAAMKDLSLGWKLARPFLFTRLPVAKVDVEFAPGDVLDDILPGLHVIATPGHSNGHVSFWAEQERVLLGGDVMMNLFGLRLPLALATADMAEARRSIKKVADLGVEYLCLGHGPVIRGGAQGLISAFAARL